MELERRGMWVSDSVFTGHCNKMWRIGRGARGKRGGWRATCAVAGDWWEGK